MVEILRAITKAAQAIKDLNKIKELRNAEISVQKFNKDYLSLTSNEEVSLKDLEFCSRFYPILNLEEKDYGITFHVALSNVEITDVTNEEVGKFISTFI